MEDHELWRREHLVLLPAHIDDMFMNLPLVAKVAAVPKDAQLKDRTHEAIALILVDVDEAADHADDGLWTRLHLFQQRAHLGERLRAEMLIGVEEENPVALCLFQRSVLRGGKVVLPRMMKDACARLLCHLDRAIGRSRIDDNHLVSDLLHRGEPCADIFFFVLRDHTRGKLHASTSFIHAS